MPIPVVCGSCNAKLVAPDATAGKKVKCKSCQSVIVVPVPAVEEVSDFEYVEAPKPASAKPIPAAAVPVKAKSKPAIVVDDENEEELPAPKKAKAKVVVDDDEEDKAPKPKKKSKAAIAVDEDEDDTPKRGKKKSKPIATEDDDADEDDDAPKKKTGKNAAKKKMNPLLLLGFGGGALFAVAAVAVAIWYVAIREKPGTASTNTNPTTGPIQQPQGPVLPAGWTKYEKPEFSVAMLDSIGVPEYMFVPGEKETVRFFSELPDKSKSMAVAIIKLTAAQQQVAGTDPERALDDIEKENQKDGKSKIIGRQKLAVDGHIGRELKVEEQDEKQLIRVFLAHGYQYLFAAQAKNWADADEMARIFFDHIKIKATDKFGSGVEPLTVKGYPNGWTKYDQPEFVAYFADKLGKPKRTPTKPGQFTFSVGKQSSVQNISVVEMSEIDFLLLQQKSATFWSQTESKFNTNGNKLLTAKEATVDGFPARFISFQNKEGIFFTVLVLANNRLCTIVVSELGITEESPIYKDFIANLKFNPAKAVEPPKPPEPEPQPAAQEDPEVAAYFQKKGWKIDTSKRDDNGKREVRLSIKRPMADFSEHILSDDDCKMLAKSKRINALDLSDINITDSGAQFFASNQTLLRLFVRGETLTDKGIGYIAAMKSLTYLNVRGNDFITDAGIGELAKLPKLETLSLEYMKKFEGICFEKFIDAKELRAIHLYAPGLPNSCAKYIARLKQLHYLHLGTGFVQKAGSGDLSSAGIKTIAEAHMPYHFTFDDRLLNDELLAYLIPRGWRYGPSAPGAQFKRPANAAVVDSLIFNNCSITDKGFVVLLDCVNITNLEMSNTGITDASLMKLGEFKKLKYVKLANCVISGKGLVAMSAESLGFLFLRGCPLDEDAFRVFGKMPKLFNLNVGDSKAKASWIQHLTGSKTLQHYFADGTEFDDGSAQALAKIPTLSTVQVQCEQLSDTGFAELLKLPKLQSLKLDGSETKISKDAYLKAKKDYPKVTFSCHALESK